MTPDEFTAHIAELHGMGERMTDTQFEELLELVETYAEVDKHVSEQWREVAFIIRSAQSLCEEAKHAKDWYENKVKVASVPRINLAMATYILRAFENGETES